MSHILQLDIGGNPTAWLSPKMAICLAASDRVIANIGDENQIFRGGTNRITGNRSEISVSPILLTKERIIGNRFAKEYIPPYSNRILFARDSHTCLYCGNTFEPYLLTRDHIIPKSRGGEESWNNYATSCKPCNNKKDNKTPEEWGRLLIAVPFTPNWSEILYLQNRKNIEEVQFKYLEQRFSSKGKNWIKNNILH
jgi:hypothetical protein